MFLRKVYIIGIFKKEMVKKSKNTKTQKQKQNKNKVNKRIVIGTISVQTNCCKLTLNN